MTVSSQISAVILISLFLISVPITASHAEKGLSLDVSLLLSRAQRLLDEKKYSEAENLLTKYLNKSKKRSDWPVFFVLGNAHYLSGKVQKAYEAYLKAYRLNARYVPLNINLAKSAYELKKYTRAGKLFEKAYLESQKKESELLYEAAVAYFKGNHYADSQRVLEKLLAGKHVKLPWIKLYVHASVVLKDWQKAERYLLQVLTKNRTKYQYWNLLAHILFEKNDVAGAASALEISYQLHPPDKKDWEKLAEVYFYLGVPLKGLRCLKKTLSKSPKPAELDRLAEAYIEAQRLDEALHYINLAIRKQPTFKRYVRKAKILYANSKSKAALEPIKAALSLKPDAGFANLLLGFCAWETGQIRLAQEAFAKAKKHNKYRRQAEDALSTIRAINSLSEELSFPTKGSPTILFQK